MATCHEVVLIGGWRMTHQPHAGGLVVTVRGNGHVFQSQLITTSNVSTYWQTLSTSTTGVELHDNSQTLLIKGLIEVRLARQAPDDRVQQLESQLFAQQQQCQQQTQQIQQQTQQIQQQLQQIQQQTQQIQQQLLQIQQLQRQVDDQRLQMQQQSQQQQLDVARLVQALQQRPQLPQLQVNALVTGSTQSSHVMHTGQDYRVSDEPTNTPNGSYLTIDLREVVFVAAIQARFWDKDDLLFTMSADTSIDGVHWVPLVRYDLS
jgi:hypothetical protein